MEAHEGNAGVAPMTTVDTAHVEACVRAVLDRPKDATAILALGDLMAVAPSLETHGDQGQRHLAQVPLWPSDPNLAAGDGVRDAVGAARGLSALAACLSAPGASVDALRQAARAIGNVALNVFCCDGIRLVGGVPPLVAVLQRASTALQRPDADAQWADVQRQSVWALGNLVWTNDANRNAVREAGGLVALLALLRDVMCTATGDADAPSPAYEDAPGALAHLTCRAVANMAANPWNRQALYAADGLALLVTALGEATSAPVQHQLVAALANLALDDYLCGPIRDAGALPPLVTCLGSTNEAVQQQGVTALVNLAGGDNKDAVRDAGGIPALLSLLTSDTKMICLQAALALANLCANHDVNKAAVRDAGGEAALRRCHERMADKHVREETERALKYIGVSL